MRKIASFVLAAGLAIGPAPSVAVPLPGLYEAEVPVPDQSPEQREVALQRALEIVLVRVSGIREFAIGPGGQVLQFANNLLQGYGYESAAGVLKMRARFDARAVDRTLRDLGLPVWGINRLSHQVWIAIRDDGQPPAMLDAAAAALRAEPVIAAARARGIPLTFPAMDSTDRQLADFRKVWNGDFNGIRGAAVRYSPDATVVVRIGREGGSWLSRWSVLSDDGSEESWSRLQPTLDRALAEGMHELADRQARRFAVQTGSQQEIHVDVSGVTSVEDYARVLNYLRKLNPVRAAFVDEVGDGKVRYRLQVEGDPQLLPRVIGAGSLLRAQDGSTITELRYRLAR